MILYRSDEVIADISANGNKTERASNHLETSSEVLSKLLASCPHSHAYLIEQAVEDPVDPQ